MSDATTCQQSMFLPQDFPASLSATQATDGGQKTNAGYGAKSRAPSAKPTRASFSSKTLLGLSAPMMGMPLSAYSATLPRVAMMRNGLVYEQIPQWALHMNATAGTASQLIPTPTASDNISRRPPSPDKVFFRESGLPRLINENGSNSFIRLDAAVKLISTPAAQDGKNSTLPPSQIKRDSLIGDLLRQGEAGELNPDWEEMCLMGLPMGWTNPALTHIGQPISTSPSTPMSRRVLRHLSRSGHKGLRR